MNHVQELIDENKDKMPTALAKQLLDACKEEADATKLYKLTWTMVDSYTHLVEDEDEPNHVEVKLSHKTQTLIVEAVDKKPVVHNGLRTVGPSLSTDNKSLWARARPPSVLVGAMS
jgi:hypothetical protein